MTRKRTGGGIGVWGPPLLVFAGVIALWYAISASLGARSFILPPPHEVLAVFFDEKTRQDIFAALWVTTQTMLFGLFMASLIGISWAVAMSQAKWIERSTYPYAVILQSIPVLAITPLISFWIDDAFLARTAVCVLIALFPMVSNTYFGLKSVDSSHLELFRLQKATRWTTLSKLQMPAASPAIFAGLRISAGLAVVGAVVGDFFFQQGVIGIGALIRRYQSRLQTDELFASVLVASLLGVVVFLIFGWIARVAVGRWYDFG
jgi:NitT/TauT family transport system permease protein